MVQQGEWIRNKLVLPQEEKLAVFLYVLALLNKQTWRKELVLKMNKAVVDYDKHWEEVTRTIIEKNKVILLEEGGG